MKPDTAMTLHISISLIIMILIILRFAWRLLHPVAPVDTLTRSQRGMSESVHWLLYGLVFAVTINASSLRRFVAGRDRSFSQCRCRC